MHSMFATPELSHYIIKWIRASQRRACLLCAACTCKLFSDSALDELWWTLLAVRRLLGLLPKDAIFLDNPLGGIECLSIQPS